MKLWLAFLVNEFQANPSRQQSVKTSQDRFEKGIKYFMPHISLETQYMSHHMAETLMI